MVPHSSIRYGFLKVGLIKQSEPAYWLRRGKPGVMADSRQILLNLFQSAPLSEIRIEWNYAVVLLLYLRSNPPVCQRSWDRQPPFLAF